MNCFFSSKLCTETARKRGTQSKYRNCCSQTTQSAVNFTSNQNIQFDYSVLNSRSV
jgi:hypothetical protein